MKNLILKIAAVAMALLVAAVVVLGIFVSKYKSERDNVQTELNVKTGAMRIVADRYGVMAASVDTYRKDISDLRNTNDSIEKRMRLEMRLVGIRDRQIQALMYASFQTRDSLMVALRDTNYTILNIPYSTYGHFDNGHLSEDIMIQTDLDSVLVDYVYSAQLFMAESWYRPPSDNKFFKWLKISFKKKRQQFTFKTDDPKATIVVVRKVDVE